MNDFEKHLLESPLRFGRQLTVDDLDDAKARYKNHCEIYNIEYSENSAEWVYHIHNGSKREH